MDCCNDCINREECPLYKSMLAFEKHSVNPITFIFGIHIVKICKNFRKHTMVIKC